MSIPLLLADYGIGSGRTLPSVAVVLGLISRVVGGLARARWTSSTGAVTALALGLISGVIGALHAANSAGGFGTGNGLAGAIFAMLLGLTGIILGGLTWSRSRPTT
ncbi:DUF6223 family protein [Nonomuraea sp. LPB2021202275-12-8]|uniref:DUF6223 family protein n=1 Tax=Nonomuraea sp. LPB2021202275-12-8 TaxID=3120159 RepID=UPI003FA5F4A0